jgi:uncharacterized RDD family membrane protein YckC
MISFFLRRSVAYLIDSMLMLIFVRPAPLVGAVVGELSPAAYFWLELLAVLIVAVYIVGSHARWGYTLGKLMLGLRVATVDGVTPPPLKNAFLRWLPLLILGNLPMLVGHFAPPNWSQDVFSQGRWHANVWQLVVLGWLLADVVAALLTHARRSLHDFVAHTVVTRAP